ERVARVVEAVRKPAADGNVYHAIRSAEGVDRPGEAIHVQRAVVLECNADAGAEDGAGGQSQLGHVPTVADGDRSVQVQDAWPRKLKRATIDRGGAGERVGGRAREVNDACRVDRQRTRAGDHAGQVPLLRQFVTERGAAGADRDRDGDGNCRTG